MQHWIWILCSQCSCKIWTIKYFLWQSESLNNLRVKGKMKNMRRETDTGFVTALNAHKIYCIGSTLSVYSCYNIELLWLWRKRSKDGVSIGVVLPCSRRASRRTFSIKMSGMGQFQFRFPTAEKIYKIREENQNNNHDYKKGSSILSFFYLLR